MGEAQDRQRKAMKTIDKVLLVTSLIFFLTAVAHSVKTLFVTPTPVEMYHEIVSWICAFGFASLSKL